MIEEEEEALTEYEGQKLELEKLQQEIAELRNILAVSGFFY